MKKYTQDIASVQPATVRPADSLPPINFKAINERALARIETVLAHYLPGGKRQGREYVARNPTRQDHRPGSFSINVDSGVWADFATRDKGGDLISLVAYLTHQSQSDAARDLAHMLGLDLGDMAPRLRSRHSKTHHRSQAPDNTQTLTPTPGGDDSAEIVMPIPKGAPDGPKAHPKHGKPSAAWTYKSRDGLPLFHVCRFDRKGQRKQFAPLTLWRLPDGRLEWRWQAPPTPRPLYGLERLSTLPEAEVLVCEGEKAADAAQRLLRKMACVSSMNGAQSPDKADWSPLRGRHVRIWPDADDPGQEYARKVAALALEAGALSVSILDVASLQPDAPQGWDAFDAEAAGLPAEALACARWMPMDAHRAVQNTSCTDGSPNQPPTFHNSVPDPTLTDLGALVIKEHRRSKLLAPSHGAHMLAERLRGRFAYNSRADIWYTFDGARWRPDLRPADLLRVASRWLYSATKPVGYNLRYQRDVLALLENLDLLPLPTQSRRLVPFRNVILDIDTGETRPLTPETAQTWNLPYDYQPDAQCPRFLAWLGQVFAHDPALIELIRAVIATVLRGGAHLQRYIHFIGPPASGKSTLTRILAAMLGDDAIWSTELAILEGSAFEPANFLGKRLIILSDAKRYGGEPSRFKALTGQDPLRIEVKHKQAAGTFIYDGMVLLVSNHALTFDDFTGIARRALAIPFERTFSPIERRAWQVETGGEAALMAEIPGIINWALSLPIAEAERLILDPPLSAQRASLDALQNDPVTEWLMECCIPDRDSWVQIGRAQKLTNRETGAIYYARANEHLYPNYLQWALENGRAPISSRRFRQSVIEAARSLGLGLREARRAQGQGLQGLKLKLDGEQFDWVTALMQSQCRIVVSDRPVQSESRDDAGHTPPRDTGAKAFLPPERLAELRAQSSDPPDWIITDDGIEL